MCFVRTCALAEVTAHAAHVAVSVGVVCCLPCFVSVQCKQCSEGCVNFQSPLSTWNVLSKNFCTFLGESDTMIIAAKW